MWKNIVHKKTHYLIKKKCLCPSEMVHWDCHFEQPFAVKSECLSGFYIGSAAWRKHWVNVWAYVGRGIGFPSNNYINAKMIYPLPLFNMWFLASSYDFTKSVSPRHMDFFISSFHPLSSQKRWNKYIWETDFFILCSLWNKMLQGHS